MPILKVAKEDEHLALRLLTALVRRWDTLPLAIQALLIKDAASLRTGAPAEPAQLMSFVALYKRANR